MKSDGVVASWIRGLVLIAIVIGLPVLLFGPCALTLMASLAAGLLGVFLLIGFLNGWNIMRAWVVVFGLIALLSILSLASSALLTC